MPKKIVVPTPQDDHDEEESERPTYSNERIMPPLEPQRSFFSRHKAITTALVLLLLGAAASGTYYFQSGRWDKSLTNFQPITHRQQDADPLASWSTYSNGVYKFELKTPQKLTALNADGSVDANDKTYQTLILADGIAPSIKIIQGWSDPSTDPYYGNKLSQQVIGDTVWYTGFASKAGAGGCDVAVAQTYALDKKDILEISVLDDSDCVSSSANDSEGYNLLTQILATFKFDEQAQVSDANSGQIYTAKNFTLTMQVPEGYAVKEGDTYILASKSPYAVDELGMDNAFLKLTKYDGSHTKTSEMADYKKNLKNAVEGTVTIDGLTFPTLTGEDWGRFQGDTAGDVKVVFFGLSWLEMISMPQGNEQSFDPIAVGDEILNSFKFSK